MTDETLLKIIGMTNAELSADLRLGEGADPDETNAVMRLAADRLDQATLRAEHAEAVIAQVRALVPRFGNLTDDQSDDITDLAYNMLVDLDDLLGEGS